MEKFSCWEGRNGVDDAFHISNVPEKKVISQGEKDSGCWQVVRISLGKSYSID